jgi:hypothetical protein
MPASKISTGHRAQRAARTGAAGIPSEWAAVVGQAADFEPDSDAELLDWMGRQVTGLSAWAEALVELPRVFRTGNLRLFHAASCPFRYSSKTSCGVRYPSVEWRRVLL